MYCEFYKLREEPFNVTSDPSFLFLSATHTEALNHLLYGIEQRKGFLAITGEIGAGKTTLCRALLKTINMFLLEQLARGHNAVLIIDEAQNLRAAALETVRSSSRSTKPTFRRA